MQGKGLIKFFLVLMLAVCAYQFSLYIPTNQVEKDAAMACEGSGNINCENAYLDSLSNETVFSIPGIADFTYNDLKRQQLALGLDLKGGMSVVMQVDLRTFLEAMSNESNDQAFKTALDNADAALVNSQSDYITLFADQFQQVANGQTLSRVFSRNQGLQDEINFDTPDGEVISLLRARANETVQLTFDRLKERIDKLGVVQPNASLDTDRDLIIVELPGIKNRKRALEILQATAELEFWNVYRASDAGITQGLIAADDLLKKAQGDEEVQEQEISEIINNYASTTDDDGNITIDSSVIESIDTVYAQPTFNAGPLLSKLSLMGAQPTSIVASAKRNEKTSITNMLNDPQVKALFPADLDFKWGKDAIVDLEGNKTDDHYLYAIKTERGRASAPLEGDRVIDASAQPDPTTGKIQVSLEMDNKGAQIWGQMTTAAAADNRREVAIVLDNEVVSAPSVNQAILGGNSSISGNYTIQEAQDLANILKIGKLPAKTKIIQEKTVGPTLGADNISRSQWSLIIGTGLVLLFMMLYYAGAGLVSILALVLNIIFIFAALASYGTVLTLPGFAGIVLTIGMAVDANVIIFERIREELRAGKSTAVAISDGFKYSYSAIIDANVTTIITALVLAKFGLGPIKGFAVVLIIGVLASLFTAVLVGRLLFNYWVTHKGKDVSFATGFSKGAFANLKVDWLGKRKIAYGISLAIIVAGAISMATSGFDLGVDFKGGSSFTVALDEGQQLSREEVASALDAAFQRPTTVKSVDNANSFDITTSYGVDLTGDNVDSLVMLKLHEGFNGLLGGAVDIEQFQEPSGTGAHVESAFKIRPTIADDIRNSSYKAGIFALLLIFLYILIRFSKWQYSAGAIAALFHDVLIVLTVFSIGRHFLPFPLEIDQNFIAAILTVIGYSINDTVVVFDRIREFMGEYTNRTKKEIINLAINNTISRTIITSLTTLFVVAVLFFFGGTSTRGLAFALLVGILVGTYSSIFVATPVMSDLSGELKTKEAGKAKKSFSKAAKA